MRLVPWHPFQGLPRELHGSNRRRAVGPNTQARLGKARRARSLQPPNSVHLPAYRRPLKDFLTRTSGFGEGARGYTRAQMEPRRSSLGLRR